MKIDSKTLLKSIIIALIVSIILGLLYLFDLSYKFGLFDWYSSNLEIPVFYLTILSSISIFYGVTIISYLSIKNKSERKKGDLSPLTIFLGFQVLLFVLYYLVYPALVGIFSNACAGCTDNYWDLLLILIIFSLNMLLPSVYLVLKTYKKV